MSSQLDILALEPFFGGIRRQMLETVIRCSRHRWTLLKLPPRRMERRLMAAAHWFSEILSRHYTGKIDLVFTSEAMNLADLFRLVPPLAHKPSVVYFHSNQLPLNGQAERPWELVNLNTATAASEVWFNSLFHLRAFLGRASALVEGHSELSSRNPMPDLIGKAQVMPPPIDTGIFKAALAGHEIQRQKRTIFVDTREANLKLLNSALHTLQRRGEKPELITVGPVEDLCDDVPRRTVSESDDPGQIRAVHEAGVIISTKLDAPCDHHAVRALSAGCWPIWPKAGVYPELLPEALQGSCLYDGTADSLASRLQDCWHLERPTGYEEHLGRILQQFDAIRACRAIDERLEELAVVHSIHG